MSSNTLFKSNSHNISASSPIADTVNKSGSLAYSRDNKNALAQFAMTGCFSTTAYTTPEEQLKTIVQLASTVDPTFLAKLAVFTRTKGYMKDTPALLAAILTTKNPVLLNKIFTKVVDSPKMIRNFVQILRSGATGRKSLGTNPKKLVQKYLNSLSDEQLFRADVGNNPSLVDIIKMVHPKPETESRNSMYGYLLGKSFELTKLPEEIQKFEAFKKELGSVVPNVPFQMLTALPLTEEHWKYIAKHATWTQIRMNLNTFARHKVFEDSRMVEMLASRLEDENLIKKAKVFPYQLFTAYQHTTEVPNRIKEALIKATELSLQNIPYIHGRVVVAVDVSGSMSYPVTGTKDKEKATVTKNIEVAALFASAMVKKNPDTLILPFDTRVHSSYKYDTKKSILENARELAKFGGGGTDISSAMKHLNDANEKADLVIIISDNESNVDTRGYGSTTTRTEWDKFKQNNQGAKLVCLNISPSRTVQVNSEANVLNLGGFSDTSFEVIANFREVEDSKDAWVNLIEKIEL